MVRFTVLGSGDAFGAGGRAFSAYLVEAPGATFLVDAGPTVLQGLKRAGCSPERIDFVLLSHLHGDHFGGLPFLFMQYVYEAPRTRPLTIYGPVGTERRVAATFSALFEHVSQKSLPFPLGYRELTPGSPIEVQGVRVVPVRVPHAPDMVCLGLRVEVAGRTIFYSGDTGWTEDLVTHARGADLFVCECTRFETPQFLHLSYPQIAARARDFGCRRLLLTHLGDEPLRHRGEISYECAEDGATIEL
jgi:ribonuclease BN (tRNA processing enzyme)